MSSYLVAGKLMQRVVIQAPPDDEGTQDAYGQPNGAWTDLATRWASVEPLGLSNTFDADQVRPGGRYTIRHRYVEGLTPRHRYKWGTRILRITDLVEIEARGPGVFEGHEATVEESQ